MNTGDPTLDFVLSAGPRTVTPDTPEHVILEVGKYQSFAPFREEMKRRKLARIKKINAIRKRVAWENKQLREQYKANPSLLPYARIPEDLIHELEAENKEQWNPVMREHTLQCYPELKLNMRR